MMETQRMRQQAPLVRRESGHLYDPTPHKRVHTARYVAAADWWVADCGVMIENFQAVPTEDAETCGNCRIVRESRARGPRPQVYTPGPRIRCKGITWRADNRKKKAGKPCGQLALLGGEMCRWHS